MTDTGAALASVVRHTSLFGDFGHDDIAATVDALAGSADPALVPEPHRALDHFLDEENSYGRDLTAGRSLHPGRTTRLPRRRCRRGDWTLYP